MKKNHYFLKAILGAAAALIIFLVVVLEPLSFGVTDYFKMFGMPFTHKRFLVILQNDAELRPTGGFITSYAIVNFDHGLPTGFEMKDVYFGVDEHEYIKPPYPLGELLASEYYNGYTFRDANFNPDFPEAVQDLLKIYKMTDSETRFDGVFAVNYSLLEDALRVLGTVRMGDMELSHWNVFEELEYYVSNIDRHNVDQLKNRKGVLKDLANKVLKKALLSPLKYRALSKLITTGLEKKNVLMWFANHENEYEGSFPDEVEGDFFAFNSANYGGMKTDRYLRRDIRYFVTIDRDNGGYDLTADVNIEILHTGGNNTPLSGDYSGYVRAFLPLEAKLLSYSDTPYYEENDDFLVLGEIVELKPGESKELHYSYELPPATFDGENYHLRLQKQSGANDHYSVYVRTPDGTTIVSPEGNFVVRENTAYFDDMLEKDLDLWLAVLPDKFGPRLVYQDFLDSSTIVLHFNEDLPSSAATDPLNYSIHDLNYNVPDTDQKIEIYNITHQGSGVFIHLKEPVYQEEEHFAVEIKNVYDLSGNFVEPNPKLITVVQNFIK
ncbi:MAG: DUF4012 domain-containing protein [Patescibacteria group bacterium]|nr:DUF4012 domain-containing protein [Patescibacteria group bacterium]